MNDAIRHLVDQQRVHAVGVLVGAPSWPAGAVAARRMREGGVDLGVHLDFTEHALASDARQRLWPLILRSHLGRLERAVVRREIRAQLEAFESGIGHAPSFVDGHQHVHQLPVIRGELVAELEERYGGPRPWLRRTRCRFDASAAAGMKALLKSVTIEALGASALAAAARRHGFRQNGALLGVYDFSGGPARYLKRLRGWLGAARSADLLMCHPGRRAAGPDPLAQAREAEYQVLSGDEFGALIRDLGLVLRPMSAILADAD